MYVSDFASELYAGNIDVLLVFNGAECKLQHTTPILQKLASVTARKHVDMIDVLCHVR